MWRYEVFARKLSWYFTGVYIIKEDIGQVQPSRRNTRSLVTHFANDVYKTVSDPFPSVKCPRLWLGFLTWERGGGGGGNKARSEEVLFQKILKWMQRYEMLIKSLAFLHWISYKKFSYFKVNYGLETTISILTQGTQWKRSQTRSLPPVLYHLVDHLRLRYVIRPTMNKEHP